MMLVRWRLRVPIAVSSPKYQQAGLDQRGHSSANTYGTQLLTASANWRRMPTNSCHNRHART
jgi:hypothetical protein